MINDLQLKLIDGKNYETTTSYHIIYLDTPYPYNFEIGNWIDWEIVEEKLIMDLDMTVYEEVLDKIFQKFSFYDCYEITNFFGDESLKLLNYLEDEKKLINNLSKDDFEKKYEWVFDSVRDDKDFLLDYDKKEEFNLIFSDINLIIETLMKFVKMSIDENKCVTVVGI